MADEGATTVGQIVGYLILNRTDWSHGVDETKRDADSLGRLSPDIRISTNSGDVIAQLRLVKAETDSVARSGKSAGDEFKIGLIPALAAVAPAALPIAAVAGGALIGLLPVIATVALGVKGIANEMKNGSLTGTQYGQDIDSLKSELSDLQGIAAGGLLSGLDQALKSSHGLFPEVNADVQMMSTQIGNIIAGAGPALLKILTALNPLFVTFGDVITTGANELENWANNSTGVQSFVGYVQKELPVVLQFLGEAVVLFSHLAQGAAPFGGVLLQDITAFVGALDKIPVDVLRIAIPLLVSTYAAVKLFEGASLIFAKVGTAVAAVKLPFAEASAAAQSAAAVQARAAADEAAAYAALTDDVVENSAVQVAAFTRVNAAEARQAAAASAAAAEIAAAEEEKAAAAEASAVQMRASAGKSAGSMASLLGPIALVGAAFAGVGFGISHLVEGSSNAITVVNGIASAEANAKQAADSWTQSLIATAGALNQQTEQSIGAALQADGVADKAAKAGISLSELTAGVTGSDGAFTKLIATMQANGVGTIDNTEKLGSLHTAYQTASTNAAKLAALQASGTTVTQTAAQVTAQLTTALQALGQTEIAQIQTEDAFKEGLLGVAKAVKDNGKSLSENTKGGLANRDMLTQLGSQALSTAQAQLKNGASITTVSANLASNVKQLEATATKAGLSKSAVQKLVAQMGLTPADIYTKFHSDTADAIKHTNSLKAYLRSVANGNYNIVFDITGNDSSLQTTIASDKQQIRAAQAGHHATGTQNFPGGLTWVGERGPELLELPSSSKVYTNTQSEKMAAQAAPQAASAQMPDIYVQNPFTGEYLLAQVSTVADSRVTTHMDALANQLTYGRT